MSASTRNPTYFDGDLRARLLEVAEAEVAAHGPAQVSLRSIAKRAGVSHAAPAHHFRDKLGLFTAMAAHGFAALSARMQTALTDLGATPAAQRIQHLGMVYLDFAQQRPGLFAVMWRPELHHRADPALRAGWQAVQDTMTALIVQARQEGWTTHHDLQHLVVLGWATVHGLAVLWRDGPLAEQTAGQDSSVFSRAVLSALADALATPDTGRDQPPGRQQPPEHNLRLEN